MKRFLTLLICAVCVLVTLLFGGCSGCKKVFDFNGRTGTEYYPIQENETYCYYKTDAYCYIRLNKTTGETDFYNDPERLGGLLPGVPYVECDEERWSMESDGHEYYYAVPQAPVVLSGRDNGWREYWHVSRHNYPLLERVVSKYENGGIAYIHTLFIQSNNGGIYGFVNAYAYTTGALPSGGSDGVSGISYGVFLKYNPADGTFDELCRVDGGCILAFDEDTVLFYKNKAYYTQNVGSAADFICNDYAYDSGLTSYSYASFFFNDTHFVIYLHVDRGRILRDYAFIINTDGKLISSCAEDITY